MDTKIMPKILLVGLDDSGKTTLLYQMKYGENTATHSTLTFNRETLYYAGDEFDVWDLSGQQPRIWDHILPNTDGVIFVVDSSDRDRFHEAREVLKRLDAEDRLKHAVFLVFANKQDLPNVMTIAEISEKLGLNSLMDRNWLIKGTSATSGDGINEGMDWFSDQFKNKRLS